MYRISITFILLFYSLPDYGEGIYIILSDISDYGTERVELNDTVVECIHYLKQFRPLSLFVAQLDHSTKQSLHIWWGK